MQLTFKSTSPFVARPNYRQSHLLKTTYVAQLRLSYATIQVYFSVVCYSHFTNMNTSKNTTHKSPQMRKTSINHTPLSKIQETSYQIVMECLQFVLQNILAPIQCNDMGFHCLLWSPNHISTFRGLLLSDVACCSTSL